MLTNNQQEKLREALVAEKARLLRNAQDGLAFSMNRDVSAIGRDSIDESMAEEMFSTELRLRDREKWLLGKINSALDRLEKGSINQCEDCDEEIGFKRLMARPVTTQCIACKEEREREERAEASGGRGGEGLSELGGGDDAPPAASEDS
jgi:DnaK suppressor protein